MRNFRKLTVWQKSMKLFVEVYEISKLLPAEEKFNLVVQIRKDVVSISSNIAEGCSKSTNAHFRKFLEDSIGSAFELESQLIGITLVFPFLKSNVEKLFPLLEEIQKMLNAFIEKLKQLET
jgi:four helix bundle protein